MLLAFAFYVFYGDERTAIIPHEDILHALGVLGRYFFLLCFLCQKIMMGRVALLPAGAKAKWNGVKGSMRPHDILLGGGGVEILFARKHTGAR